ncbi:ABC transporter permease [Acidobacteriota bacterium]
MSKRDLSPPPIASRILKRVLPVEEREFLFGDIKEIYKTMVDCRGRFLAWLWIWGQVFLSSPRFIYYSTYWRIIMFQNFIKIAIRNIKRQKGYTFINLTGLALGMACCLLIILYIHSELSYDRYHENAEKIFRINTRMEIRETNLNIASSNHPLGPTLARDYPEVLESVRLRPVYDRTLIEIENRQFFEDDIMLADNTVFDVFSFKFIRGDRENALARAYTIVLTETAAERLFGSTDPVGKTLRFDNSTTYTVTGIMEDVPPNSHFTFDMLCSFETYYQTNEGLRERWLGDLNNFTYILLQDPADAAKIDSILPGLVDKHAGRILKAVGGTVEFKLQPMTQIHLNSGVEGEIEGQGDIAYIYIFAAVAVFILLIACFNFMNLSTARSTKRAREVGLRKVLGSERKQLIAQFLNESLFHCLIALVLAVALVALALPMFRSLSGSALTLRFQDILWLVPAVFGFVLITGFIAGSYPAFFLSSFQPIRTIKGHLRQGKQKSRFRSLLVVVQFAVSITLIIGTIVILNQLRFMKSTHLGFNKEQVLVLQIRDQTIRNSLNSLRTELKKTPGVIEVAASSHVPASGARRNAILPEGFQIDESQMVAIMSADPGFLATMGIELASGRNFDDLHATDDQRTYLINETAARRFGWEDPVGKTILELDGRKEPCIIVGVVKDFHFLSLRMEIEPVLIEYNPSAFGFISLRIQPANISQTLGNVEKTWGKLDPTGGFDYFFLDQSFDSQYRSEERLSTLFSYFTFFAIFIACLGLFGLAAYSVEQRTKEIGIRKVLGSSYSNIIFLLSKDFVRWVLLANIIAWPLAYFAMNTWLQDFAYRTALDYKPFLISATAALLIAFLTVSYQAIKAGLSNPVDALRNE